MTLVYTRDLRGDQPKGVVEPDVQPYPTCCIVLVNTKLEWKMHE